MINRLVFLLIELWVLLLIISKVPEIDTWPLRDMQHSGVFTGNDFLKLFTAKYKDEDNGEETASSRRVVTHSTHIRIFNSDSRKANENARDDSTLQVVKLVTSGSKIVFLEDEYDEDDAINAANIEIQRKKQGHNSTQKVDRQLPHLSQQQWQHRNLTNEIKILAISTSSSTKRAYVREHYSGDSGNTLESQKKKQNLEQQQHKRTKKNLLSLLNTTKPLLNTTPIPITIETTPPLAVISSAPDFINLSQKSVLLIEEVEPLKISQNITLSTPATDSIYTDFVDSAPTNIRNQLAPAAGSHSAITATTHRRSNQNTTRTNHPSSSSPVSDPVSKMNKPFAAVLLMEDKLLPFQTVIYHDTNEGHGPQSRSISYSSISQNVDHLPAWQKSRQFAQLAEAQRNVNENLKPLLRSQGSEPAQFYSVPAKMYSIPSKFYSKPSKIYSEPAKVYAKPEQVYSEPAKNYGEPSKVYSEPSKVYSQPAKVYGQPAETYWPRPPSAASTGAITSSIRFAMPTSTTQRSAIVSRIAFGETQIMQISTDAEQMPSNRMHLKNSQQQNYSNVSSQPRRFLFNLDKLPYDLLNAPEQSTKLGILESTWNTRHRSATAMSNFSADRQYPCLESSSSLPTSSVPNYQHSSLHDQHSNQNTKGLLERDLVKCVSKYSHSSATYSAREEAYTTERSHAEEQYTPTSEQTYEIDESVSVMTNGQNGSPGSVDSTTTTPLNRSKQKGVREVGGETSGAHHGVLYNFKANANIDDAAEADQTTDENDGEDGSNNYGGDNKNLYDPDDDSGSKNNNGSNGKDESKVAYVVEGRNYRKYRVEEKTDDGFIVGEYGVVDHNDGNLRGVRYTADSTINRSLLQKALLTFLKLK